jgi:hypothetical protein
MLLFAWGFRVFFVNEPYLLFLAFSYSILLKTPGIQPAIGATGREGTPLPSNLFEGKNRNVALTNTSPI